MLSARKSPTSVLCIVKEESKAKSGSRRVQAWWETVECSSREETGVRRREHVKVTGPRVPARQTLVVVGQDDPGGQESVGGELRTERQRGAAQHRAASSGNSRAERSAVAGGRRRGGVGDEQLAGWWWVRQAADAGGSKRDDDGPLQARAR